jgi:hypothetical protein
VGSVFLIIGTALFAVSVLAGSDCLLAVTNVVIGVEVALSGAPLGGVLSITLGLSMLLALWNRQRRRKRQGTAVAGAKSRALRDALVRRMRGQAIPIPT